MVTPGDRLERAQEAWASWRAEDYSWDGLARKPWEGWAVAPDGRLVAEAEAPEGSRAASLQDYWREEEERLFQMDGRRWTRVHCPMHMPDGRPVKAAWSADELIPLQQTVLARLEQARAAGEAGQRFPAGDGRDGRAQLQGAVLVGLSLPADGPVAVSFAGACFVGAFAAASLQFADRADFKGARFFEDANFSESAFLGDSNFNRAQFFGDASFLYASFRTPARFPHANFLSCLNFVHVRAEADVDFDSARFHSEADFEGLDCSGHLALSNCEFHEEASLELSVSLSTRCWDTVFHRSARFDRSRFRKGVDLQGATFNADLSFDRAEIGAGDDYKGLNLSDCEIAGRASFLRTRFAGRTRFEAAHFAKVVRFDSISWPAAGQDWHGAFRQARFDGPVALTGSGFGHFAAFDGADLAGGVELEGVSEWAAKRIFLAELKGVPDIVAADVKEWAAWGHGGLVEGESPESASERKRQHFREQRLRELEGGCRVLKLAMGKASNRNREHLLFRFELIARRAQRDTPRWEKAASHIYSLTSDYGASMIRPLGALALSLTIFAILFFALAAGLDGRVADQSLIGVSTAGDAWNALSLSWSNTFRPLAVLSARADDPATSWSGQLLYGFPPAYALLARVLATLESLTALVLAFLFALALRRRFHMSS